MELHKNSVETSQFISDQVLSPTFARARTHTFPHTSFPLRYGKEFLSTSVKQANLLF